MKKSVFLPGEFAFRATGAQADVIQRVMKEYKLCRSEAIRFIITRYGNLTELLDRADVKIVETKPRVELEFPR